MPTCCRHRLAAVLASRQQLERATEQREDERRHAHGLFDRHPESRFCDVSRFDGRPAARCACRVPLDIAAAGQLVEVVTGDFCVEAPDCR